MKMTDEICNLHRRGTQKINRKNEINNIKKSKKRRQNPDDIIGIML